MDIISSLHGMGPALLDATGQGVLWGIMVLGVYITYKLLDIADLTVDGSFALGGCVCAVLISKEVSPAGALLLAALAGMAAGFVTGILHTVFEIPSILAGILTQISLWSINLWIMGDKSNVSLLKVNTVMKQLSYDPRSGSEYRLDQAAGFGAKQCSRRSFRCSGMPEPELCGYPDGYGSDCNRPGGYCDRRGALWMDAKLCVQAGCGSRWFGYLFCHSRGGNTAGYEAELYEASLCGNCGPGFVHTCGSK